MQRGIHPPKSFFNTSGKSYRDLGLKDRVSSLSETELVELLAADGMLIKRPILVRSDTLLIGFKPSEWEQVFA